MNTVVRRTRLRPERVDDYLRVHARIPEAVAQALIACGVARWEIWRDGVDLVHVVETTHGYAAMEAAIAALGPIDPAWDATIAEMLDADPATDRMLSPVWRLERDGSQSAP